MNDNYSNILIRFDYITLDLMDKGIFIMNFYRNKYIVSCVEIDMKSAEELNSVLNELNHYMNYIKVPDRVYEKS